MNIHYSRIEALRSLMSDKGWDAVIVSGSDPHSSEYPAERWQQVKWLSGFTGEAGDLVITREDAGLWTDSRYFIQAADELEGSGVVLHKMKTPGEVTIIQWLTERPGVIAIDGLCFNIDFVSQLRNSLAATGGNFDIISVPDLICDLWDDRPEIPVSPVITLSEENVGESRYLKLTFLRKFMMLGEYDAVLLSSLDEIAYILNIRGEDIEYNPYTISYLIVTQSDAFWFARKEGTTEDPDTADSFSELESDGVTVLPYYDLPAYLNDVADDEDITKIFIDESTLNYEVYLMMLKAFGRENIISGTSPVILKKAVKNSVEQDGMRTAFLEDGVAMEKFLFWLDCRLAGNRQVTEWEASEMLTSLRTEIPGYKGNSFANISAYGANAALPHYSTPEIGSAVIEPHGLYLVDSGGQYLFGTTDITRTVPVGECSYLEKEDYTLVLKGMIALSMAVFPKGTAGCQLDILARNALWRNFRNFGHGTGHGLGFYLGVHEGPQSIRQNFNSQPILPGMITSNEPGIYREGHYGVRHENIILCIPCRENEFGEWLCFETLTLCHIDTSAIIRELMTEDEIAWLNEYNRNVRSRLTPYLDAPAAEWLERKTQPL